MRTSKGFDIREEKPIKGAIFEPNLAECPRCGADIPDDILACPCNLEVLPEGALPRKRVVKVKPSELPQLPFGDGPGLRVR